MKKSNTLTATLEAPKGTSLYQQMEKIQEKLEVRLSELEFAHYVLSLEKQDWAKMGQDLVARIKSENFVSTRSEVDALLQTILQTIKNYESRLDEISLYTKEAKNRLATIKSAIASLDIMDNIALAVKGGVNTEGLPSMSNTNAENELSSIKTLLHSTKALVELRTL